jgi:hypothetical protein
LSKDQKTRKTAILDAGNLTPEKANKWLLEEIFAKAKSEGRYLTPDAAFKELLETAQRLATDSKDDLRVLLPRVNLISLTRKLHHHAVDVFYETYFPTSAGAPPFTDESLKYLLDLARQGLTHRQIAEKLGLPTHTPRENDLAKDKVRKRVKVAKKKLA